MIETFSRELKALITRYGFTLEQVSQALAIVVIEMDENRKKALFEGKK